MVGEKTVSDSLGPTLQIMYLLGLFQIAKPQKIKFNLPENEYIDSIFCGWFQTFVRTQKGRIFCTVTKN